MTHLEPARLEVLDNRRGQRQQANEVRHVAARLADQLADLKVRQVLELRQALVGACLLDRVEILALDVLDQRQRGHFALFEITN